MNTTGTCVLQAMDLAAVEQGLRARLLRFYGEIVPRLPVESAPEPDPS